jgi:hypothetical protein
MMQVDDDVMDAMTFQKQQIPHDQGCSRDGEQGFGNRIGERPQPCAQAGGKDHGFHWANAEPAVPNTERAAWPPDFRFR